MSTETSRVWFITGASTGFGRKLAEAGVGQRRSRCRHGSQTGNHCRPAAGRIQARARAVRLDVTDPAQVKASVEAAIDAFDRIDVLVNMPATDLSCCRGGERRTDPPPVWKPIFRTAQRHPRCASAAS